ncbi:putative inactive purple acid phosphatase 9 [Drosera capensis]
MDEMPNLEQVGSEVVGWTKTYSFVSRNEESDETTAFLFGDMGTVTPYSTFVRTQAESTSTVKWLLRDIEFLGTNLLSSPTSGTSAARVVMLGYGTTSSTLEPIASKGKTGSLYGNQDQTTLTTLYSHNKKGPCIVVVLDMVEILASGQVISGGGGQTVETEVTNAELKELSFSQLVKVGSVLMLTAFVGDVIGYVSGRGEKLFLQTIGRP